MGRLSTRPLREWECSHRKPCTSLLDDPKGVLTDRRRWPTHLCYDVMVESCRRWAVDNAPDHVSLYPLPLDDGRRALLALRVRSRRSTLDLFALEEYEPPALVGPGEYLWVGGLAHSLHGYDDVSLLHIISQAHDWWRDFPLEKIQGRPKGSGVFESRTAFQRAVSAAQRNLEAEGRKVTQEAVAKMLHTSDRQLRKWMLRYGITWREAKRF